ncbi:MAG: hypothetical protein HKN34_08415 [Gammaproteobacteria bacterium]|nr:hypothetical protein [Gammaproteobacteria bacterium]
MTVTYLNIDVNERGYTIRKSIKLFTLIRATNNTNWRGSFARKRYPEQFGGHYQGH